LIYIWLIGLNSVVRQEIVNAKTHRLLWRNCKNLSQNTKAQIVEMTHAQKNTVVDLYDRVAPQYGRVGPAIFLCLGRRLAELTGVTSGACVLDVATGRGASLFPVSEIIGDAGRVIGIDLSAKMVSETFADISRMSVRNATVLRMDAEQLAFRDESFNYLLCGFAMFLFPQPDRTLSEWRRVLRPGGKVGISVAGRGDERWLWYEELLIAYHSAHNFPLSPGGSGLRDPEAIEMALSTAGFIDTRIIVEDHEFIYGTEQDWWEAKWTHGARYPLEQMKPEVLNQFRREVLARLAEQKMDDRIREKWRLIGIVGLKPTDG
jgi:ubiquinone/menaquinone biosynthesis C-methylase UbiE